MSNHRGYEGIQASRSRFLDDIIGTVRLNENDNMWQATDCVSLTHARFDPVKISTSDLRPK